MDPDNPRPSLFENSTWRSNMSLLKKFDFSFDLQVYPQQMRRACK
ncbi:hypothetical protein D1BOALGB6SA_10778 [Olavius sp. associated proteobacterium Delta 1]|nr:hypothetical protein D1BOALGB6SA_10778 [Olavius sp. associated proteobacterium Delta 1]